MRDFVELHLHDNYSLADAPFEMTDYIERALELGYRAIAQTNHNTMSGIYSFNRSCKDKDGNYIIKPIFGVEMYEAFDADVRGGTRSNKKLGGDNLHSLFIALDNQGLKAIFNLLTYANSKENIFNGRGAYDYKYLLEHRDEFYGHVVWSSACIGGRVGQLLERQMDESYEIGGKDISDEDKKILRKESFAFAYKEAKRYLKRMEYIFGKENTFLEIQYHRTRKEYFDLLDFDGKKQYFRFLELEAKVRKFAYDHHDEFNLLITNDTHFPRFEDANIRNLMDSARRLSKFKNSIVSGYVLSDNYLMSGDELFELFMSDDKNSVDPEIIEKAISNSILIADRCNLTELYEDADKFKFPSVSADPVKELRDLTFKKGRLRERRDFNSEELERIDIELNVIEKLEASSYMLIAEDLCRYCDEQGILRGPGRGSVGGSYVAYLLGITRVNPFLYDLYFERFLNLSRFTMADIDFDFPTYYHPQIRDYLSEKYGADNTALIKTYQTWQAKEVYNRLRKTLEPNKLPILNEFIRYISELKIASKKDIIDKYDSNKEFKDFCDSSPIHTSIYQSVLNMIDKKVGMGIHAAGMLISDRPIKEFSSLTYNKNKKMKFVDMDMKEVENQRRVKLDILAVNALDAIMITAKEVFGDNWFDMVGNIDLSNQEVYEFMYNNPEFLFSTFQFGSDGMANALAKVKPTNILELSDVIALYRPGALKDIDLYANNKNTLLSGQKIEYLDKSLIPILNKTYGVIMYQEQVIEIANKLAGWPLYKADELRYAISKKKVEKIMIFEKPFIDDCVSNNLSEEAAVALFDKFKQFGDYGFNKSHSVAYSVLAFWTAYFLCYYPYEWYKASILARTYNNTQKSKILAFIAAINSNDYRINVRKPSILSSKWEPQILEIDGVKYLDPGLLSIKAPKSAINDKIRQLLKEKDIKFVDVIRNSTHKQLKATIETGLLDELGERNLLLAFVDIIEADYKKIVKKSDLELKDFIIETLRDIGSSSDYTSLHSFEKFISDISIYGFSTVSMNDVFEGVASDCLYDFDEIYDKSLQTFYGLITSVTEGVTSKGDPYLDLSITIGTKTTNFESDDEDVDDDFATSKTIKGKIFSPNPYGKNFKNKMEEFNKYRSMFSSIDKCSARIYGEWSYKYNSITIYGLTIYRAIEKLKKSA